MARINISNLNLKHGALCGVRSYNGLLYAFRLYSLRLNEMVLWKAVSRNTVVTVSFNIALIYEKCFLQNVLNTFALLVELLINCGDWDARFSYFVLNMIVSIYLILNRID